MDDSKPQHKPHRKTKEKKERPAGSQNPKAFALAHPGKFRKQAARSAEVKERRLHVPLVDRVPEEAPPLVVGVVGPPGVGKTTLIKSLVRRYAKQTLSDPRGPVTVVTGKRRRLTFMECPADSLASMIDFAKIVDIVLLLIDGNYGFEMETMEFLNVLSSSGMPGNVFGILTHLDLFKKQDTLRTRKKQLKHRFWSELYQGAKLFYLSGVVNGRYPDREVLNISRFLSVMKNPRPLVWRNSHPYCLADRMLDITPPTDMEKNPKCDRTIALYGYVRGTNFPAHGAKVHIPGIGDLDVSHIEGLPDPCPTPFVEQEIAKATGKSKPRRLGEKQKILFAPMSDVGGVTVDKDAVYIDVKKPTFNTEDGRYEDRGFGEQMVIGLQGDRKRLGQGDEKVRLFAGSDALKESTDANGRTRRPIAASRGDEGEEALSDEDEAYVSGGHDDEDASDFEELAEPVSRQRSKLGFEEADEDETDGGVAFADSDSDIGSISDMGVDDDMSNMDDDDEDLDGLLDDDDDDNGESNWKNKLADRTKAMLTNRRPRQTKVLARLMYDLSISPVDVIKKWKGDEDDDEEADEEVEEDEDAFFKARPSKAKKGADEDRTLPTYDAAALAEKWTNPENVARIQSRFASHAGSKDEDGEEGDEDDEFDGLDEDGEEDDESDEGDGDFEDLEAPSKNNVDDDPAAKEKSLEEEREKNARKKEELKLRFEEEDRDGFANDKANARRETGVGADEFGEDEWYDAQKAKIQKQLDINRSEFDAMDDRDRVRVEGYKAGTYARIVFSGVPFEFAAHFNPRYPLIVGGLTQTETRYGFVQVRIKRHRWHSKILKNNDPLIFSLGWRRFQSIPIYSISDSRTRNRMLKYTPEHMHCFGTFYGPLCAPNTGFCALQSLSTKARGFRVAATGVVLDVDESTEIVKKLKLKGYPHKIFKNTAILRDMFASDLEIAKFKAGQLRTVSGVRGMVKGPAGRQFPDGYVRAGFEDKILKSDIVFLSAWRTVQPRRFCMPVTNLLTAPEVTAASNNAWTDGMRLTGTLRAETGAAIPQNKDSFYRGIERQDRHFNPLQVPRKLAAELPFKSQIARMKPQRNETYMAKRAVVVGGEERRARDLMQKLATLRKEKSAKRAAAQERRREPHRRRVADDADKKAARERRERDAYWKKEGRKRKNTDEGGGGGAAKRRG